MSKQLSITYKGNEYCLEYTRKSVETLEKNGFVASDITDKPITILPQLFAGAFLAHHRFVKNDVVEDIFKTIKNKDELIGKLAEMYNEPIMALLAEPEDEAEGNAVWTANW